MNEWWSTVKKELTVWKVIRIVLGIICIVVPVVVSWNHAQDKEKDSLNDATAILEDEEKMDAYVQIANRGKILEGSTVEIYLSQDGKEQYSGATGLIVGITEEEILIATPYKPLKDEKSILIRFFDRECVEGIIRNADASVDIAIVAVCSENIPSDIKDKLIVPVMADIKVKEGITVYGYVKDPQEGLTLTKAEVVDAKHSEKIQQNALKLIKVCPEKTSDFANHIFYTEDIDAVGISVRGEFLEDSSETEYILPMDYILELAGIGKE